MPAANLLFQHTFDGAGYPDFNVVWPAFSFPASGDVNALGRTRPVVDGHGRGLPSRTIGGVTWRAKSTASPGRQAHRTALWAKWKNAGFAGRREVGIVVRYLDAKNCLVVRLRSMGTANPELRLFKVVNGVATQLGATYTGADVSATQLNAGVEWAVRVEDIAGGDGTKVDVYVGTQTTASRGTLRLSWTGDVGMLRGLHTSGVELHDQVYGDDVRIDPRVEWPSGGIPIRRHPSSHPQVRAADFEPSESPGLSHLRAEGQRTVQRTACLLRPTSSLPPECTAAEARSMEHHEDHYARFQGIGNGTRHAVGHPHTTPQRCPQGRTVRMRSEETSRQGPGLRSHPLGPSRSSKGVRPKRHPATARSDLLFPHAWRVQTRLRWEGGNRPRRHRRWRHPRSHV